MPDYSNDPLGFVDAAITPALQKLSLDQGGLQAPTELLLGTALQESGLTHRVQMGGGPALGLFQMEPRTHDDIWNNFLKYRPGLATAVRSFLSGDLQAATLQNDDRYAAAMARVHYYRMGEIVGESPIPAAGDIPGMAAYWKTYYNTGGGAGSAAQFLANWESRHGAVV